MCRRPQNRKPRTHKHYRACPCCKGFFSKLSLHRHFRRCSGTAKGTSNILVESRRTCPDLHILASKRLIENVFPHLHEDIVTNQLRYDEAAILYGNWQCSKYRQRHLPKMIRARMRLLGRFLVAIKQFDPSINCLTDALDPKHFDNVVNSVNQVARQNNRQ